jgi:hypothetical protein
MNSFKVKAITFSALFAAPIAFAGPVPGTPGVSSLEERMAADPISASGQRLTVEGDIRTDIHWSKNTDGDYKDNIRLQDTSVTFKGVISDNIRVVVTTALTQQLREAGVNVSDDFDIEEFVRDAYIELRDIAGIPSAVVVGKHQVAFGLNATQMPSSELNPLYELLRQRQVFGFTVALPVKDLFDLEASVFETEENDFEVGSIDGFSIRLSKKINENLSVSASGMLKLDDVDQGRAENEYRASLGVVYRTESGFSAYVEGLYLKDNALMVNENQWGFTGGVSQEIGNTGTLVAEVSWLQDTLTQFAVGYNIALAPNITVGPEVRYTIEDGQDFGDGVWAIGGRVRVTFGNEQLLNKKSIIGGGEASDN